MESTGIGIAITAPTPVVGEMNGTQTFHLTQEELMELYKKSAKRHKKRSEDRRYTSEKVNTAEK